MPDPFCLNDPRFLDLALEKPRLFDLLTRCMTIQHELDPQAGFGALAGPSMWYSLELPPAYADKLLAVVKNEYELYVVLRALTLRYESGESFFEQRDAGRAIPFTDMLFYILSVCNDFDVDLARSRLTEETASAHQNKHQVRPGGQRKRKAAPRASSRRRRAETTH